MVGAFLNGVHPRSEALIRTTWDFDKGKIAASQLDAARKADVERAVKVQGEAGFSHVTDGNLRWQDLFRPFLETTQGYAVGPITRYFETNTFFKQPLVSGDPKFDAKNWFKNRFDSELLPRGGAWKAVLPSPYHFAKAADAPKHKRSDVASAFAKVLNEAAQVLMKNRYQFIQFNEPQFLYDQEEHVRKATSALARKDDWDLLVQSLGDAAKGIGVTTCVQFFHGDPTPFVEKFQQLPTDAVGIDFTLVHVDELPKVKYDRGLNAGVLDAQNSYVESPVHVAKLASAVKARLDPEDFWLGPNTDLQFVPTGIAEEKIRVLGKASKEVIGA